MPLTGSSEPCRCGSVGCWELEAGARGLLRAVGRPEEGDRMLHAEQVSAAADPGPGCAQALERVAEALGRGIGALVNAQDPEAVALSGLAAEVYQAAPGAGPGGFPATLVRARSARPAAVPAGRPRRADRRLRARLRRLPHSARPRRLARARAENRVTSS